MAPHPTCTTGFSRIARSFYREASSAYARTGDAAELEIALDAMCWWVEIEEDARVERDARWRAWLARIYG